MKEQKKIKIAILQKGFEWGGGVDFIKYIIGSIEHIGSFENHLILSKNDKYFYFKKLIYPFYSMFINRSIKWEKMKVVDKQKLATSFSEFKNLKIHFISSATKDQFQFAINKKFDLLLPCISISPKKFNLPWIGYIYDFQHKYLPEFFTTQQIIHRDYSINEMLNTAKHVLVNSYTVKNDIDKFIVNYKSKVHVIPFAPIARNEWIKEDRDLSMKYGITKPYFIVCNQFWVHKDHKTAIKAFKSFLSLRGNHYQLVMTGNTSDHRFPDHFKSLIKLIDDLNISSDIKILGHLPKIDQISLMKKSVSVIQPTLFEGGPGGGSSFDAISLGIPLIVSDIEVNKEIGIDERIFYFNSSNEDDLVKKMDQVLKSNFLKPKNNDIISKNEKRLISKTSFFINLVNDATNSFN